MIKREYRRAIKAHIGEMVATDTDYVLHAEAREIGEDNGLIRILYRVWYVMGNKFDCAEIGAIWSETGLLWIQPEGMEYWDKYGARDAHCNWEELGSGPDDICFSDIPRAAELAWIDWMTMRGHWDDLMEYYEGEGESFLKGFPRGTKKAFMAAKAERRLRESRPITHTGGTIATGMGILTAEEYREAMFDDPLPKK